MGKHAVVYPFLGFGFSVLLGCAEHLDDHAQDFQAPTSFQIPSEQQAIVQAENGGPEVLQLQTIPVLEPGADEVLIKVVAAAVNPIDRRLREGGGAPPAAGTNVQSGMGGAPAGMGGAPVTMGGASAGMGGPLGAASGPRVPGMDMAGTVVQLGENVTHLSVGDAVFAKMAFGDPRLNGAFAEYAVVPANQAYPKPTDQTYAEAAGLGTVGVTALRTIWHADVQEGERVFINGIGGGIGSSAAQFAKERGAYVLGTASGRHANYLSQIGVDEHINYREVQFDEVITEPVDVVIETVGSTTANQALNIMTEGSRLVSISGPADAARCEEIGAQCSRIGGEFGWPNSEMLAEVARLAEAGAYRLNVDSVFPLAEAGAAQEQNYNVGTSGKVIVIVDADLAELK